MASYVTFSGGMRQWSATTRPGSFGDARRIVVPLAGCDARLHVPVVAVPDRRRRAPLGRTLRRGDAHAVRAAASRDHTTYAVASLVAAGSTDATMRPNLAHTATISRSTESH
jgi:hypothetical protein